MPVTYSRHRDLFCKDTFIDELIPNSKNIFKLFHFHSPLRRSPRGVAPMRTLNSSSHLANNIFDVSLPRAASRVTHHTTPHLILCKNVFVGSQPHAGSRFTQGWGVTWMRSLNSSSHSEQEIYLPLPGHLNQNLNHN